MYALQTENLYRRQNGSSRGGCTMASIARFFNRSTEEELHTARELEKLYDLEKKKIKREKKMEQR